MPAATYDDLFGGPWANNRKHEATHRQLSKSIGESLRGEREFSEFWIYRHFLDMDFSAYLLLYGITFYNVTDEAIERLGIIDKDRGIIKKVRGNLKLVSGNDLIVA